MPAPAILALALLLTLITAPAVRVEVAGSGDALVSYFLRAGDAPAVLEEPAIGEPYFCHALHLGTGEELPVELEGGTLKVVAPRAGDVEVECVTALASKTGRVWSLEFSSRHPVEVVLPENAVTLAVEPEPALIQLAGGNRVSLFFGPGKVRVEYVILPPGQASPPPAGPVEGGGATPSLAYAALALAAVAAIVAAVATFWLLRQRKFRRP